MDVQNKRNNFSDKNVKKNNNLDYLKKENYSKQSKGMYTSKELREFISNVNKFNFNSAFGHKGAKSFLHSKTKALKEINLDENILYDEENSEKEKKHIKDSKIKIKSCKGLANNKSPKIIPISLIENINVSDNKYTQSPKKRHKVRPNIKKNKSNNLLRVLDNGLKLKKKHKKFCSEVELKMYQDEDVNKIHPIKTFDINKNCKYKSCNDLVDSHSKKRNTKKSNSTLIDIVNEISHNIIEI